MRENIPYPKNSIRQSNAVDSRHVLNPSNDQNNNDKNKACLVSPLIANLSHSCHMFVTRSVERWPWRMFSTHAPKTVQSVSKGKNKNLFFLKVARWKFPSLEGLGVGNIALSKTKAGIILFFNLLFSFNLTSFSQDADNKWPAEGKNYSDATTVWSRDQIDTLIKDIQDLFDELLDVEVGMAALQIRHISNVGYSLDNFIGLNGELRDTLEFTRQLLQSEVFIRSYLQYDHFYTRLLNRKNYSPSEKEISNNFDKTYDSEIKYDIKFYPAWDTTKMDVDAARKADAIAFKVKVSFEKQGEVWIDINQKQIEEIFKSTLEQESYTSIKKEAQPAINATLYESFDALGSQVEAIQNFDESTILKFTTVDQFVAPGAEEEKLNITAEINQPPTYSLTKGKLDILIKNTENENEPLLVYSGNMDINPDENTLQLAWDGIGNQASFNGEPLAYSDDAFTIRFTLSDNENFEGDKIFSKETSAWVKPDEETLNTLYGFAFQEDIYTSGEEINIDNETEIITIQAVNQFGNLLETPVVWNNELFTENEVQLDVTNLPLNGTELIAELNSERVSLTITREAKKEVVPIEGDQEFGPLDIRFDSEIVKVEEESNDEECTYKVDKASFPLTLADEILGETLFNVEDASLVYKTNCETGNMLEATVKWSNSTGIDVGTIGIFSSKVKGIELTIDNEGKMSGSVDLNTRLDDDVSISDYIKLKKGLNSNYSFDFIAGKDFSGTFDFAKISGINIDILRGSGQKQPVAKITGGSITKTEDKEGNEDYIFKGTAELGEKLEFETGGFKAKLNALSVSGELTLNSKEFNLKEGNLSITLKGIPNIKGDVVVSATYKNYELSALADLSESNISVYGLTLSGKLLVKLNSQWELSELVGSDIQASHKKLTSNLTIGSFLIKDGALQNLTVTNDIKYQGFNFELTNCSYDANAIKPITINAKLALGDNKVEVKKLQIDKDGNFTCDKISTKVSQKFFEFNAGVTIKEDLISGDFSGWFIKDSYGLEGHADFGTALDNMQYYNYGYFKLTVKATIPLIPGVLNLSQIGGEFGYNCGINLTTNKLYPQKDHYVAGLNFGLAAAGGALEVVVDPARVQFGNDEFDFDIKTEVNIPKSKPYFVGTADLALQYPEKIISGSIGADIKVPPSNGMLINATNNKVFFESAGGTFKIASNSKFSKSMNYSDQILKSSAQSDYNFSGDLNATLFNFINLNGNIYFIKDDKGNFEGSLSGIAYIDFDEHFDLLNFESIGTTADLDISIKARALIETSFSDEGLGEAEFGCYLGLNATGNVNLKDESITFGGDFEAWGNISLYKEYGEVNAGMEIMLKYYRASKNKEKSYSFSKDFNYKIY